MAADHNCLSFWLPRLIAAGVPVPRTEVVRTEVALDELLDGEGPDGFDGFMGDLHAALARIPGDAWFLRTGHGSAKHSWSSTCYVDGSRSLEDHVVSLVEWSAIVDVLGLPVGVWAVREFLPLQVAFHATAYDGMPVAREYRAFLVGGEFQCVHPYWPIGAVEQGRPDSPDWRSRLARISGLGPKVEATARDMVGRIAPHFTGTGDWSIDLCPTVDGHWYVTDMARAGRSFHWPDCPYCPD